MEDIITLVGPRATGKSTIGRELAQITGYRFIDFDVLMEQELKSEGGYFAYANKHGWPAYMKRVQYVLKGVLAQQKGQKIILDLGGGIISSPEFPEAEENAKLVREHSRIFLILPHIDDDKNIQILIDRELKRGVPYMKDWPLEKMKEKITQDYLNRLPGFKKYAHHQIYAKDQSPLEIAEVIVQELKK